MRAKDMTGGNLYLSSSLSEGVMELKLPEKGKANQFLTLEQKLKLEGVKAGGPQCTDLAV